jgi:alpha-L-fucosidase
MNRRKFLQLYSGAIGYSLAAPGLADSVFDNVAGAPNNRNTSPTSSESPEAIDRGWQKASAQYDVARSALLQRLDDQNKAGPFSADWSSLATYQVPDWYKDAKFGIFIHWGVYSVPAFGSEWYPRDMYIPGTDEYKHQIATYGPLTNFGYKNFIPMFKAKNYDPSAWARVFKESGAKYVVPVFEHHDGFAMYDLGLSDWTAVKMGPRRDLVGDLAKAVRAQGLHLGASSHRIEHDWFMDGGRKVDSDVNDPEFAAFYGPAQKRLHHGNDDSLIRDWTYVSDHYANDWLARNVEIVTRYQPELMWFDWWIGQPSIRPYIARFAAFYYNESSKRGGIGVINYKYDAMNEHSAVLDLERGELGSIRPLYWQTDTSVSNKSWGYIRDDTFKSPEFIVHQLIDIVSKNGNLLLNVGPRSDGTIPSQVQQVLRSVGTWLNRNGEAIYGTRPWKIYGEGPTVVAAGPFQDTKTQGFTGEDFRFTTKGDMLYAIQMARPSAEYSVIRSLGTDGAGGGRKVRSVTVIGTDRNLQFDQQAGGLKIQTGPTSPGDYAIVFRIRFDD